MKSRLQTPQKTSSDLIDPNEVINTMIDLRIQMAELELQAKLLQPAFFAACLALDTETINLERAAISRKLTPGLWDYSLDIIDQNNLLRDCKSKCLFSCIINSRLNGSNRICVKSWL
jgi:hypothetical protein